MIPWVLSKKLLDDVWCWQTESEWNLIINVSHSILLATNIFCAIVIIKILYSKIKTTNISSREMEKIKKYRRLAKSIFMLVPVFGLHFIIFAWVPYAVGLDIDSDIEKFTNYAETFFNALQVHKDSFIFFLNFLEFIIPVRKNRGFSSRSLVVSFTRKCATS